MNAFKTQVRRLILRWGQGYNLGNESIKIWWKRAPEGGSRINQGDGMKNFDLFKEEPKDKSG